MQQLCYLQKPHVSGRYTKAFCPGVFCPVGISVQEGTRSSGGHCPGGLYLGRGSLLGRPPHGNKQAVRILVEYILVTVRNEVAKVMFLQVCVCPWGVCLSACWDTPRSRHPHPGTRGVCLSACRHPPGAGIRRSRHPQCRHPPGAGTPLGPDPPDQTPPSRQLLLRMVRILLECILVAYNFSNG